MTLILGATGTIGGEVAKQFIAAGHKPRLLVRNAEKAKAFANHAEIVVGDLDNAASVAAALSGIKKVFLVSAGLGGQALEVNVIDAAKKAGVSHIVKLSVITAENPTLTFATWHAATEKHLQASGLAWTLLRPGNFHSNALGWAETIKSKGVFYSPTGTGKWASIDPADIGAVAVKALTSPGHEGKAYTLTGPESVDAAGYAAKLAAVIGKPVAFVDVPPEAAKDGILSSGVPLEYAEALLNLLAAMKANRADYVSSEVETLLGRKATSFEDWAKRNVASFT